jgi:hypothetical protein
MCLKFAPQSADKHMQGVPQYPFASRHIDFQGVRMNATRGYPVHNAAEPAPFTPGPAGQGAQSVVPARGDAGSVPSHKIADIIGVIDQIALQTRSVAQSAAAEAARAGSQGQGFALVAAEVKSLAQRSAAAVKEIKGMIGDSVYKAGMADEDRRCEFEERAKRWQKSLAA